jgi:hypothetical protein
LLCGEYLIDPRPVRSPTEPRPARPYRSTWPGRACYEAGLPLPGFPHEGDELVVAIVGEGQRPAEQLDLGVAVDEPGEAPRKLSSRMRQSAWEICEQPS